MGYILERKGRLWERHGVYSESVVYSCQDRKYPILGYILRGVDSEKVAYTCICLQGGGIFGERGVDSWGIA